MKDVQTIVKAGCTAEESSEIQLLVESAQTVDELVNGWFQTPEASLEFGTGLDDDEQHTLVYIGFARNREVLVEAYIPISTIRNLYPTISPALDCFTIDETGPLGPKLREDPHKIAAFEKQFPTSFHDDLCGEMIDRSLVTPLALSYALCNIANISIEKYRVDQLLECFDEIEDKTLNLETLSIMHIEVRDEKSAAGFGSWVYFNAPSLQAST